tara:strand:+ start:5904 stop:6146 length:243 start_codon:yes stop_codon:yes gene_type:complete
MTETEFINVILNGIEKLRRIRHLESDKIEYVIQQFIDNNEEQLNSHNVSVNVCSASEYGVIVGINCLSSGEKIIQTIHSS